MNERGFGLVDAIVATAVMAVVCLSATDMLLSLPPLASRWDESTDARQRLRVVEARMAQMASRAGPIVTRVDDVVVRVPSLWPRRLGLWDADAATVVSSRALTIVARTDAHRELTLLDALPGAGGHARAAPNTGCGSASLCGLADGDVVLLIARDNTCALMRIADAGDPLELVALMPNGAPPFEAGAVAVPVAVTAWTFDADTGEVRVYDGYKSDSVLMDGVADVAFTIESGSPVSFSEAERGGPFLDVDGVWRGNGALGDGPFVGAGGTSFDIDQLTGGGIAIALRLSELPQRASYATSLEWRIPPWPWPPPSS